VLDGKSGEQIKKELGHSSSWVTRQKQRAITELRRLLNDDQENL
jgi:hypothetical protein